jgi:hypothetical protein
MVLAIQRQESLHHQPHRDFGFRSPHARVLSTFQFDAAPALLPLSRVIVLITLFMLIGVGKSAQIPSHLVGRWQPFSLPALIHAATMVWQACTGGRSRRSTIVRRRSTSSP